MSGSKGSGQGRGFKPLGDKEKAELRYEGNAIDETFGFHNYSEGPGQLGWLLNYIPIVSCCFVIVFFVLTNAYMLRVAMSNHYSLSQMRRVLKRVG
jgi:hypothetical protein